MGNPRGMRRDFEVPEKRRMAAVRLFTTDLNNSEIGRRLKVCDQTVSRWRAQYRAGGESALRRAGRAGRKPLLSNRGSEALSGVLEKGPERLGYETPLCSATLASTLTTETSRIDRPATLVNRPLGQAVPTRRVELPTRQAKSSDCCLLSERRASRKRREFRHRRLQHRNWFQGSTYVSFGRLPTITRCRVHTCAPFSVGD